MTIYGLDFFTSFQIEDVVGLHFYVHRGRSLCKHAQFCKVLKYISIIFMQNSDFLFVKNAEMCGRLRSADFMQQCVHV